MSLSFLESLRCLTDCVGAHLYLHVFFSVVFAECSHGGCPITRLRNSKYGIAQSPLRLLLLGYACCLLRTVTSKQHHARRDSWTHSRTPKQSCSRLLKAVLPSTACTQMVLDPASDTRRLGRRSFKGYPFSARLPCMALVLEKTGRRRSSPPLFVSVLSVAQMSHQPELFIPRMMS